MPTLNKLKRKWFLDFCSHPHFPPHSRLPGSQLRPHTDGNLVEPIIDGQPFMADVYRRVTEMLSAGAPQQHEIWLAQWRLDPVKLLGQNNPGPTAHSLLIDAARQGITVRFLGSGHVGRRSPTIKFAKQLIAAGGEAACDMRFPQYGSQHQKFIVLRGPNNQWLAYAGSADLNFARWDTPGHPAKNPDRPGKNSTSHDVSVRVRGPAVHDIALTFAERWNDHASPHRLKPHVSTAISTAFCDETIPPQGPHSVQVLRTYAIDPEAGYSWSSHGEFTIWASYLNAIKNAQQYIYIEEQYFYSFGNPPAIEARPGLLQDSDLVVQLGEAIKRGVSVLVLVPSRKGNPAALYQSHFRRRAAQYLRNVAAASPQHGRFVICHLSVGSLDPVVHSKIMLVDDEFALVGSANLCQRSMAHDSELHLGIIDADNEFVRDLRLALWQEHMQLKNTDSIADPLAGLVAFQANAAARTGNLREYPLKNGRTPPLHSVAMNIITDPYKGPPRE